MAPDFLVIALDLEIAVLMNIYPLGLDVSFYPLLLIKSLTEKVINLRIDVDKLVGKVLMSL